MLYSHDHLRLPELHFPTLQDPRHATVRAQTYPWRDTFVDGTQPNINVHGRWLEDIGFKTGTALTIAATPGSVILTLIEQPSSENRRDAINFEDDIAKNPRLIAGNGMIYEHPGRLVNRHILLPMGVSTQIFANAIGVSQDFAECFLAGEEDVDRDLARRLGMFCRTSESLWRELQAKHNAIR